LQSLTVEDFLKILTEPKSSLTKQYTALLGTEEIKLEFAPDALREMAEFAFRVNENTENIGARRLHTIMERVLDEVSFLAPDLAKARAGDPVDAALAALPLVEREMGSGTEKVFVITADYVRHMVAGIVKNQDLSRYIL